jgi:hypothetical protein
MSTGIVIETSNPAVFRRYWTVRFGARLAQDVSDPFGGAEALRTPLCMQTRKETE